MSITPVAPADVHPPAGAYSHGMIASGGGRTLYISGQVGVDRSGSVVDGFAGQAAQCWRNVIAILAAADMTVHHLVKVTTFLTDMANVPDLGRIREPFLDGARPASTLVGTPALVRPEWLIEIEAIAFKND